MPSAISTTIPIRDDVLTTALDILIGCLNPQDEGYELGGDEFLLICPDRGEHECLLFVHRLEQLWLRAKAGWAPRVELTVGFASSTAVPVVTNLLAVADQAMRVVSQSMA